MKPLFKQTQHVVLLDLSNVVYRATAVGGDEYLHRFCQMIVNYRKRYSFHRFVYAIEGEGTEERRRLFPAYKEGRLPSEDSIEARKVCRSILRCTDCEIVKAPRGEADDAIGCYLTQKAPGMAVVVSEDKDLWQLIRPGKYLVLSKRRGLIIPESVRADLGVPPSKIPLYKAVFGDTSDGLPRVPRVPKKLLLGLLERCSTVNELLVAANDLPEQHAKRVAACKTQIRINYKLARIRSGLRLIVNTYQSDEKKLRLRLKKHGVELSESDLALLMKGTRV